MIPSRACMFHGVPQKAFEQTGSHETSQWRLPQLSIP
jgi:hypothetical protein